MLILLALGDEGFYEERPGPFLDAKRSSLRLKTRSATSHLPENSSFEAVG